MTRTLTCEERIRIKRLFGLGYLVDAIIEDIVIDRCSDLKDEIREEVKRALSDFML